MTNSYIIITEVTAKFISCSNYVGKINAVYMGQVIKILFSVQSMFVQSMQDFFNIKVYVHGLGFFKLLIVL